MVIKSEGLEAKHKKVSRVGWGRSSRQPAGMSASKPGRERFQGGAEQ